MRGEGRGLFAKKPPSFPRAPHPSRKKLCREDDSLTFPGRPSPERQSPGGMAKKQGGGYLSPQRRDVVRGIR